VGGVTAAVVDWVTGRQSEGDERTGKGVGAGRNLIVYGRIWR